VRASPWIWVALGALALFGVGGAVVSAARGIRNNNPGNIRRSSTDWRGEVPGADAAFETFATPADGIRAIAKLLVNYQERYGLTTLRGLINRYAPPSENNTTAYVDAVAAKAHIGPDQVVRLRQQPETLEHVVTAIIRHENGVQPYSAELIRGAVRSALA